MTVLGEYLCMRREMQPILVSGGDAARLSALRGEHESRTQSRSTEQ